MIPLSFDRVSHGALKHVSVILRGRARRRCWTETHRSTSIQNRWA